jgi:hypothetical protein
MGGSAQGPVTVMIVITNLKRKRRMKMKHPSEHAPPITP